MANNSKRFIVFVLNRNEDIPVVFHFDSRLEALSRAETACKLPFVEKATIIDKHGEYPPKTLHNEQFYNNLL